MRALGHRYGWKAPSLPQSQPWEVDELQLQRHRLQQHLRDCCESFRVRNQLLRHQMRMH